MLEKEDSNLHDFQDSVYFNNEGRYEVRLPFEELHQTLPDNYSLCEKRLLKLYNKLKNDAVLLKNYDAIFLLSKGKLELLRPLKVQVLWETATIWHITQFLEKTKKLVS